MSLTAEQKQPVIKKHQRHGKDTGSPEVQIAVLTERINKASTHTGSHQKDAHSRRGLIGMVNNRNRLLKYLKSVDTAKYEETIKKLGLRK